MKFMLRKTTSLLMLFSFAMGKAILTDLSYKCFFTTRHISKNTVTIATQNNKIKQIIIHKGIEVKMLL